VIVKELFAKLGLDLDDVSFKKADMTLQGVTRAVMKIGAVATGTAVAGLGAMVAEVTAYASKINDAARATGVGAEALQELEFAAKLSGVEFEQLRQGLGFLSRNAYSAATGNKEAASAFRQLGVSVVGAGGKVRSADAILEDVAARFAAMPDGTRKTALAMEVFGRSGAGLLPMLSEGSDGLERMRARARELGIVLSGDTVAAGDALGDATDELSASFRGLRFAMAAPFLKTVKGWVEGATKLLIGLRKNVVGSAAAAKVATGAFALVVATTAVAAIGQFGFAVAKGIRMIKAWAIEMGWAALNSGAIALAWVALGAVVALVAEDFYQFVTGGRSMLGKLRDDWDAFYKRLDGDPEWGKNHPILKFLADVLDKILHIEKTSFFEWWGKQGDRESFNQGGRHLVGTMLGAGRSLKNVVESMRASGYSDTVIQSGILSSLGTSPEKLIGAGVPETEANAFAGNAKLGQIHWASLRSVFGNGATPSSSADAVARGMAAPNMVMKMEINARPGQNEKEIADESFQKFKSWYDGELQRTYVQVGGG